MCVYIPLRAIDLAKHVVGRAHLAANQPPHCLQGGESRSSTYISNPLTNKWDWMLQLWEINWIFFFFRWHLELIALKISWPHLCCAEISHLQCTQVSVSSSAALCPCKMNTTSGKNNTILSGCFISSLRRSWRCLESSLFGLWDEVIFPCYCAKRATWVHICWNRKCDNSQQEEIKATPLGFVIYWVNFQRSRCILLPRLFLFGQ